MRCILRQWLNTPQPFRARWNRPPAMPQSGCPTAGRSQRKRAAPRRLADESPGPQLGTCKGSQQRRKARSMQPQPTVDWEPEQVSKAVVVAEPATAGGWVAQSQTPTDQGTVRQDQRAAVEQPTTADVRLAQARSPADQDSAQADRAACVTAGQRLSSDHGSAFEEVEASRRCTLSPQPPPMSLQRSSMSAGQQASGKLDTVGTNATAIQPHLPLKPQPLPSAVLQRAPTLPVDVVLSSNKGCCLRQEARNTLLGPQPLPHGSYAVRVVANDLQMNICIAVTAQGHASIGQVCNRSNCTVQSRDYSQLCAHSQ